MKRAERQARALKPGTLVEIRWIDSGRDVASLHTELATRLVYGRVVSVRGDTLTLAVDVCIGEEDDCGNQWGLLWIPSILAVTKLRRAT